jgi:hypothetical protein
MRTRNFIFGAAVVTVLGFGTVAASCDKASEPYKDGPRSGTVNKNESDIIESPDGFSNMSSICDHGNRIYGAYHGNANRAAITAVPRDPTCAGR